MLDHCSKQCLEIIVSYASFFCIVEWFAVQLLKASLLLDREVLMTSEQSYYLKVNYHIFLLSFMCEYAVY